MNEFEEKNERMKAYKEARAKFDEKSSFKRVVNKIVLDKNNENTSFEEERRMGK